MDGPEILRALAAERQRDIDEVAVEQQQGVILYARPFLTGAMSALVRAGLLQPEGGAILIEELLRPLEQPLVDAGVIRRISKAAGTTVAITVAKEEEPDR